MAEKNLSRKILEKHLISGSLKPNEENEFKVDQVLLQDATGPMAILQFEAFGKKSIRRNLLAVQYFDHRTVQPDHRDPEDHRFLKTAAAKYGIYSSPPGNGICHQVHFERFARPGAFIVGADSHTTTHGAMGCIAVGIGGVQAAAVLAGYPFTLKTPKIVRVQTIGTLPEWVSGKDVILELLRRVGVKGGVGKVYEFTGSGLYGLPATQRAVIANMIAETGAIGAVFPADECTRKFLRIQGRRNVYQSLSADTNARYDEEIEIDFSILEPLIAIPQSPGNVVPVHEIAGTEVFQVAIGSSVNSWPEDMALVAKILKGKKVADHIEMAMNPGSRQIQLWMMRMGYWGDLIKSGVRAFESVCGPCIGMGFAPCAGLPSVRTMNRNFPGRSGTFDDRVYLSSPAVAAATALCGVITDPRDLGRIPRLESYCLKAEDFTDDAIVRPLRARERRKLVAPIRGSNIENPPRRDRLPEEIRGTILARFDDDISTDSISPAGVEGLADRANIPQISRRTFIKEMPAEQRDVSQFYFLACKARDKSDGGFIVAGENYGQGSSREHAALGPSWLGIHAVFAKSFARIHRSNLIDQGLLPLIISNEVYSAVLAHPSSTLKFPYVKPGQIWSLPLVKVELEGGKEKLTLHVGTRIFQVRHGLSDRERKIILLGGLINYFSILP